MPKPATNGHWPSHMNTLSWTDPDRRAAFDQWLRHIAPEQGLRPDTLRLASADASFRRYLRIATQDDVIERIIMDSPPALENNAAFIHVAGLLHDAQIKAPDVLAQDTAHGFLLLSDLGPNTLLQSLPLSEADLHTYFMQALDILVRWQEATDATQLPAYDHAVLMREMQLFEDWYVVKHKAFTMNETQRQRLHQTLETIAQVNAASPQVYVHRDFMPRNLMVGADGQLGVVDFQDALVGPATYDIASLMRDAFHSWEEDQVVDVTVRYWERVRRKPWFQFEDWPQDFGAFYRAVEWMGLQRHLKILGIFARLTLRDGKPQYLADTPRFIAYVRNTCARYRELKGVLHLIEEIEGLQAASGFAYGRV